MHELSIANNIVDTIIDSLSEYSFAKVKAVNLSIGVYSGVDPSSLEFCLPLLIENGPLSGATINIEVVPLVISCRNCNSQQIKSQSLRCPCCKSPLVKIVSGKSISISSVDLECSADLGPDLIIGGHHD